MSVTVGDRVLYCGAEMDCRKFPFLVLDVEGGGALTLASLPPGRVLTAVSAGDVELLESAAERGRARRAVGVVGPFWWER